MEEFVKSEGANVLCQIEVPISLKQEPTIIRVERGRPVFILGRNGTGKSALVHHISTKITQNLIYMPGSRQNFFESESLSLTPASRRDLGSWIPTYDSSPDTRWCVKQRQFRNEKAIYDLQSAEIQYKQDAANQIAKEGKESAAITLLQSNSSPVDRVNTLLEQANFPVKVLIDGGELRAQQFGATYSIARMSDGERSALIFAAEVVAAPDNTVFVIDEPELHLHPSIVVPLIEALIRERPTCGFVVCTHELELPVTHHLATLILVQGCTWLDEQVVGWDIDVIDNAEKIPENLRVDLIGSRRKILFVEGGSTSLDQPLYALLFPSVSIRTRGSCRDVMRAVEGLRAVEALHNAQAFGLVDHDGMASERENELENKGIYSLPIFAVESLYYSEDVLLAVAKRQSETFGVTTEELLNQAYKQALTELSKSSVTEHLATKIAERKLHDQVLDSIPTFKHKVNQENNDPITISIQSSYQADLENLRHFVSGKNIHEIVARYPVRESGVLTILAKALRFNGREDYEKAALTAITNNNILREKLRARLGNLAEKLV